MPHNGRKRKQREQLQGYENNLTIKRLKACSLNMVHQNHTAVKPIVNIISLFTFTPTKDILQHPKFDTTHVIYVIYNIADSFRYIGQTSKTASARFIEHIQAAKRVRASADTDTLIKSKQQLLYTHMLKLGIDLWYIYPIEGIAVSMFGQLANVREAFWIIRFKTLSPLGLNKLLPPAGIDIDILAQPQPLVVYKRRRFQSRNYRKKLQHLHNFLVEGTFKTSVLNRYKYKNIYAMLMILENINPILLNISVLDAQTLRSCLKEKLCIKRPVKVRNSLHLTIKYIHTYMTHLRLLNYFTDKRWAQYLPSEVLGVTPGITYSYVDTIGKRAFNYTHLRHLSTAETEHILNSRCICDSEAYNLWIDKDHEHIITMDCNLCTEAHLRGFLARGTAFRPSLETADSWAISAHIRKGFTALIQLWSRQYNIQLSEFFLWLNSCIDNIDTQLHTAVLTVAPELLWTNADTIALINLQRNIIITYVDKADKNFAFICKKYYVQRIVAEYTSPTYAMSERYPQHIIKSHHGFAKQYGVYFNTVRYNKLAYAYTSHKAIKVIADVRHIAGSYMCSMQPLSLLLNDILNKLKPKLQQLWFHTLFNEYTGDLPMWLLKHSLDIPNRINYYNRRWKKHSKHQVMLRTYDIKTLYTNIQHKDLLNQFQQLLSLIADLDKHNHLLIARTGNCYKLLYGNVVDHTKTKWKHLYNLKDVMNMLEYLVTNTYITVCGKVCQQAIGIPMGTNAGVNIVDFYLTKYELDFMRQLKVLKKWDLLTSFSSTLRYVDDILSIDNDSFPLLLYLDKTYDGVKGIYPSNGLIIQPVEQGSSVTYMDTHIAKHNITHPFKELPNTLFTRTYDKRNGVKYKSLHIIKYPHISSLLREEVGYNIISTQCHRYIALDMHKADFIRDVIHTCMELIGKGYNKDRLLAKIKRFLLSCKIKILFAVHPFSLFKEIKRTLQLSF
jgi:hypothetical protein